MQSDRPLNQQKAAKASIKLRRLAPNRGIHRYPRDTERHKSTFLAKIGFTNQKHRYHASALLQLGAEGRSKPEPKNAMLPTGAKRRAFRCG